MNGGKNDNSIKPKQIIKTESSIWIIFFIVPGELVAVSPRNIAFLIYTPSSNLTNAKIVIMPA